MQSHTGKRTLKSLAEHMGLSLTTVSRVLSGQARKYRIGRETEKTVLNEAARLDIAPNKTARSLRLQRTHTLGLLVPDIANPFFGTLAKHIESEARKAGYSILLCDSGQSGAVEVESLWLLNSNNVDGVIAAPLGDEDGHFKALYRQGKPVVLVDRYFSDMAMPFVSSDNYKASLDGMEYLLANGHRKIACIRGLPESGLTIDRVRGYRDALAKRGVAVDERMIVGNQFDQRQGYLETKLLLKRNPRPSAIFSLGSAMAFGALSAIIEEGLRVPDDISLLSFDEQPYFAFLAPPLTAISQQNAMMGEIAVRLIIDRIEQGNKYPAKQVLLPTKLNIRESVRNIS